LPFALFRGLPAFPFSTPIGLLSTLCQHSPPRTGRTTILAHKGRHPVDGGEATDHS
jgi:hypothetical protein